MEDDDALNVDLKVKLVILFIFTDIQRVKTWLFGKVGMGMRRADVFFHEPRLFLQCRDKQIT